MNRPFAQVDVFTQQPYLGNPVAVVLDASGLTTDEMQRFANWTNLSETTFVLPATSLQADYQVRIFTTSRELPFAGHPTLGTCHAWVEHGGTPRQADQIIQECAAGLIPIRRGNDGYAFAAPPRTRTGPVDDALLAKIADQLRIDVATIVDAQWIANGPGWIGAMLASAEAVLAVRPGVVDEDIALIGSSPAGAEQAFEVRAFFPKDGATAEDPVTGSANASLAQWFIESGHAKPPYRVRQGTALERCGIVHIDTDAEGTVWVGGGTITGVTGSVVL